MRALWLSSIVLALAAIAAPASAQCPVATPVQGAPPPAPLPVFPADNWWNVDISNAPVDANSAAYITWIGPTKGIHPDFGGVDLDLGEPYIYGIPYAIVDGSQPKLAVTFEVWDESDGVNMDTGAGVPFYPIPAEAISQAHWIEGGPPGTDDIRADNDRHLLMVDCTNRHLYELYNVWYDDVAHQWHAYSGAFFDLDTNDRRPDTWTSADASGMALFPGLVRYDEANDSNLTDLGHALRMTTRDTNGYVYPASHDAGNGTGAPPLGARLRLKALVNGLDPALRTNDPMARRILRTLQKYGGIIADNGSDMYVTGTYDTRWDNGNLNPALGLVKASDFEVVQLGWQPPQASLSINDTFAAEGNAGTKVLTFTVMLSQVSAAPVTFDIATSNNSAGAGTDYVAKSLVGETIAAGQLSKTFTVTINGDTTVESNETFSVILSNAAGAGVADSVGYGTILNDDGPTLSVGDASVVEGNSGTKQLVFTVSLSQAVGSPVTYNITTANGTAGAGSDYVTRTLAGETIAAGQLSRTFAVTLNGDTTVEANEFFVVNLTASSGASILDSQGLGNILNDDGPVLTIADANVSEGNSGTKLLTFTVKLSQAAAGAVTYNIATANANATGGVDYVTKSLVGESIPAGQLSRVFQVTINGDTTAEFNEVFYVNLNTASGATLQDGQASGLILNDDGPTLSIADLAISEGNSGTKQANFTVQLSQAAAGPVVYGIATANGPGSTGGQAGTDYVAKSLSGETIPAGQLSRPFSVTLNGDTTVEPNELVYVNLNAATGATILDAQANVFVVNDDGPTLSIGDVSISEGNSGTKTMTFTVSLSQAAPGVVTFGVATGNGSAVGGSDFVAVNLTGQTIAAGMLSKTFTVTINGDTAVEANEVFTASITSATGATIADATALGTITNDD
jgi:hypothetical protein